MSSGFEVDEGFGRGACLLRDVDLTQRVHIHYLWN